MNAYILTREHNEYDQYGEYFVAWFHAMPSLDDLRDAICDDDGYRIDAKLASHILNGGGRIKTENIWWNLRYVESGSSTDK